MTDLVAELRKRHDSVAFPFVPTTPIVGPTIFSQAADEIERLDQLHREVVRMARELAEKDREILRLKTECTRLATRNAVLVCEIDDALAVRDALYRGEG
jgi:Mg2+ and Co2+ transporter CorA